VYIRTWSMSIGKQYLYERVLVTGNEILESIETIFFF